jgi:WW domain
MKTVPMRSINVAFIAAFLLVFKVQSSDFLPHGWTEHSSNGVAYYHNQRTGITQWEKPVVHTQPFAHSQQTRPPAEYNLQPSIASTAQKLSAQKVMGSPQLPQIPVADAHDYSDAVSTPTNTLIDNGTAALDPNVDSRTTRIVSVDIVNASTATSSAECNSTTTSESLRSSFDSNDIQPTIHNQEFPKPLSHDGRDTLKSVNISGDSFVVQDYNAKILMAEQKIDDLNGAIDDLEDTKAKLSLQVQSDEESKANITFAANATAMSKVRENAITYSELKAQIEILKTSLIERNEELVILRASKKTLEAELVSLKAKVSTTGETILELRSNFTSGGEELKASKELLSQQERELADAYKEIGQLEEDMRSVAGPSLKRLRQPSFFARILVSAFPVWVGGKGSIKSSRRAKGRAAAALAVEETATAMNRTVESLRENLTSLASTLTSKEAIIDELSEQLVERTEEADMRSVDTTCKSNF